MTETAQVPRGTTVTDAAGNQYEPVPTESGKLCWVSAHLVVPGDSHHGFTLTALARAEERIKALEVSRSREDVPPRSTPGWEVAEGNRQRALAMIEAAEIRKCEAATEGRMPPASAMASTSDVREVRERIEQLEWAIVRTLYAGDIEPPNPTAPFWFREQLLTDSGLTMERCRELMELHRGKDRVARL